MAVRVREKIDEAMMSSKPRYVILDLSSVEFMDSSGLGLILGRYSNAADIGAKLIITKPSKRIKKILEMAGIERIIEIKGWVRVHRCARFCRLGRGFFEVRFVPFFGEWKDYFRLF